MTSSDGRCLPCINPSVFPLQIKKKGCYLQDLLYRAVNSTTVNSLRFKLCHISAILFNLYCLFTYVYTDGHPYSVSREIKSLDPLPSSSSSSSSGHSLSNILLILTSLREETQRDYALESHQKSLITSSVWRHYALVSDSRGWRDVTSASFRSNRSVVVLLPFQPRRNFPEKNYPEAAKRWWRHRSASLGARHARDPLLRVRNQAWNI